MKLEKISVVNKSEETQLTASNNFFRLLLLSVFCTLVFTLFWVGKLFSKEPLLMQEGIISLIRASTILFFIFYLVSGLQIFLISYIINFFYPKCFFLFLNKKMNRFVTIV